MTENELLRECVASREYLFKQMIDLCLENGQDKRAKIWKWICDNRKWPSRYKVMVKEHRYSRPKKGFRYGWYMSSKLGSNTMEEVEDKGSSTIPYELQQWNYISSSDLKIWETEEDAMRWLVDQLVRMLEKKEEKEAMDKQRQANQPVSPIIP